MKRVAFITFLGTLMVGVSCQAAPMGAYSQIMQAVLTRDEALLKYLISAGININATDGSGYTALCTTVENQDYQGFELLLSQGASLRTRCMHDMNPEVSRRFLENQPPLGTYYPGAAMTATRAGNSAEIFRKDATSAIASLPFPHWGEFLIGGLVVGGAIAAGAAAGGGGGGGSGGGGSGGSSSGGEETEGNPWAAPLDLKPEDFSAPSLATLSATSKTIISDVTDAVVENYKNEYAGGKWTSLGNEVSNIDFLKALKADAAYARGYSGTKISRDEKGILTTTGWNAVTTTPITVAVMDTGLLYHTDLSPDLYRAWSSEDNYRQSIGLNYEYGVYSVNNNKSYWKYETKTTENMGTVTGIILYKNGSAVKNEIYQMTQTAWNKYAGKFAPVCGSGVDNSGNCLTLSSTTPDSNGYYTAYYVSGYGTSSSQILATYNINHDLWKEYKNKYGETGYVYDSTNATPNFFSESADHGTHVSGIVAALRNGVGMQGVAYNAKILPVKLDFEQQYGMFSQIAEVADKSQIINLSIGPEMGSAVLTTPSLFISNDDSKNSVYWQKMMTDYDTYSTVAKKGAIQVFSSGNNGQYQASIYSAAPLISEYEDAFKNLVINVVALGDSNSADYHTNTGDIAPYSNRCGATASYCLAAPGGTDQNPIVSTGISSSSFTEGYVGRVGTSQAAPMVSGSLAVLMGAFPFLKPQEAVEILFKTATYIDPTPEEISEYNTRAVNSGYTNSEVTAYDANTNDEVEEGKYNAIYGHGLVNLDAATSPVGRPKITFDTTTASSNTVTASASSMTLSPMLAGVAQALPAQMIVLDDYERAFAVAPSRFVKQEKHSDTLRRTFRSFMTQDEQQIQASEKLSFAFSQSAKDRQGPYAGAMHMMMRPDKNISMRFGYTQDTRSFGGTYVNRALQNPFMNMRETLGADLSVQLAKNWALTSSWYTGKNGFIDEDVFDKMNHQPQMQFMEAGAAYQAGKNVKFSVSGGLMKEEDSLLGMRGTGAFDLSASQTRFVSAKVEIMPYQNFRLSGSYTYGMTEADKANSLISLSKLTSDSFALAAEYQPNEKQKFGVTFVSPLRVRSGTATFDLPVARDLYTDTVYRDHYSSALKPTAREYDLSFFYTQQVNEDLSWAGETGVRLHPDHQAEATPDYRALFKMNWKW